MIDLSKCTELVNGWKIVYGPVRVTANRDHPWEAVVDRGDKGLSLYSYTDEGRLWAGEKSGQDLKLPEPEWVYVRYNQDAAYQFSQAFQSVGVTHRYQAGKPETMEKIDD